MLLNNNEVPEKFYIFVNQLSPITYNNYNVTKTFVSAAYSQCSMEDGFFKKYIRGDVNYLPFVPSQNADLKVISPFYLTAINEYVVEYNAELKRKSDYLLHPSRLSATFAFGDFDTCKIVAEKYCWPLDQVKEFRLYPIDSLTRVIKVNMEIISLVRHANKISSLDPTTNDLIYDSYWSGKGEIGIELPKAQGGMEVIQSGVIWEYLIEGSLIAIS